MTGIMHCMTKNVVLKRGRNDVISSAYIPTPLLAVFLNGVLQTPGRDYTVDLVSEDIVFSFKLRSDDMLGFMYDREVDKGA